MKMVNKKKGIMLALLFVYGLFGSISANAQSGLYTITDLGNLGGPRIYVLDINDSGQVVGCGDTNFVSDGRVWKAFVANQNGIQPLFTGDDSRSSANAINKQGVIAGYKNGKAFLLGSDNAFKDLGVVAGDPLSWGIGINNASKPVGYGASEGVYERGVLWEIVDTQGNYGKTDLGNLGGSLTRAASINDSDQIVGNTTDVRGSSRAFRWQRDGNGKGVMKDLGALPGFSDSAANRINNKGEVIGYSLKYDSYGNPIVHASLWKNDIPIDLESLNSNYSVSYGINDATIVVGMRLVGEGVESAFIWDATNQMRDLNSLVPPKSGWILAAAYAINNKGQIVGYGYKDGSANASAFLLTPPPIDEPDGPFDLSIDILPWNSHNRVNWMARWGLIPVAILSGVDFNAPREVAKKSLKFGRTGHEDSLAFCAPWNFDVNRDGRKDLICYFHEGPAKFQCGDQEGILNGKTKDGEEFVGRDLIEVVPCKPHRHWR
jgi:uncharacterized membrane protein